jgi:hypothetical protein
VKARRRQGTDLRMGHLPERKENPRARTARG